jgi:hypothetical protein
VPAGDLALVAEHLDHEGGRRQGEAGADQQRGGPVRLEQPEVRRDDQCRDDDLQGAEAEQCAPQIPQAARLHLEADQEKQQHHAELGELAYAVDLGGDERPRRMRPDDHAGDQQPENRPEAKMPEHRDGDRCDHQQEHG